LEETPPELVADVMQNGIILSGGGALLADLDRLIKHETNMPVKVAEEPLSSVVAGTGLILEDLDHYRSILVTPDLRKVKTK
ncbi:MAG: rod shape-determining protein, partial [Acidobacteriota bacterium]